MKDINKLRHPDAALDARIAQLSPAKRALLFRRLSGIDIDPVVRPFGGSQSDERTFKLSHAQQRLWFLEHWEGGGALYNIGRGWWLQGRLEVARLHAAVGQLIARHESLRTVFVSADGEPRQQVLADVAVEVPLVDLGALPAAQARAQALALAQALSRQGFDLTQAPLLRLTLLRVEESTHLLVLVMHHIVSDGWSMGVFCRELGALYAGHGEPLPALPLQYPDYAQWQRADRQDVARQRQLAYWRTRLAGLPVLELPTDRPRPPTPSYRGARHELALSADLSAALTQLSQREGVTLYMLLLAAFLVLLARYSGQDDIAVGSPIAGRTRREFEDLIGFFVNTLVLRTNLSGNPRFRDLLTRVRESALDAYTHQDVPFEQLVEELNPERDVSRNPMFEVMFVLQNAPGAGLTLPGLEVTAQALDTATAKFDLLLSLREGPAGLRGILQYATDLFDAVTIARLAGHFTTLLEGIVAHPETPIGVLPLLTPAERHQLLVEWNDTAADYPRDRCIHQLFEAQTERTPEAVAAVFEDQQLSYAELNARANQLAHCLRSKGVGPDVPVGICVERSLDMVVGLLGILKAGGAYVPLDPSYPKERLTFMLADVAVPVLLTQQGLLGQLPSYAGHILCLDRDAKTIGAQPDGNPPTTTTATNLAYVIYTSGSTGRPKGVMMPHRSVCNLTWWQMQASALSGGARTLQLAPAGFDVSAQEIVSTLCAGGTLVLIPNRVRQDPTELLETIAHASVARLFLTFTALQQLAEAALVRQRALPDLREVITAGEQLRITPAIARWLVGLPNCRLSNQYGPTETHVVTSYAGLKGLPNSWPALPPIGRPIANTVVYVLDGHRQPVPVGVAGELYIGGDGLARGYCNQPELTAERFVADPISGQPGARLYHTGDRVRYLADGSIEFQGRLDTQVKLRGFRIELGEIEAVLAQQPAVREAVVLLREDTTGDPRLVAYVVAQGEALVSVELRAALKQQLPEYMVPAEFVPLPALPLTPSGKIDRKALPAPQRGTEVTPSSPPRNPVEDAVAGIWCELLRLRHIGVHDNFFDLGGHSLLAIQMLSWLRGVFGIEVSVRSLFEAPTIAELAERVSTALMGDVQDRPLPVSSLPHPTRGPLSFAQQRLWFLHQWEDETALYNIGGSWWLNGHLDVERLREAIGQLIARHESLRTVFIGDGGEPRQEVLAHVVVEMPLVDLRVLPGDRARSEAVARAQALCRQGFDLTRAPLLRLTLVRVAESTHLLVLVMHHIVSDGWSMGVFYRELGALYAGNGDPLPALPVQYPDYSLWQRADPQEAARERQLAYWRARLADLTTLELPTDRPRPLTPSYRGARHRFALPAELSVALKQVSRREGVTLYMLLLAAFQVLLARYSGQGDIAVGSPIAGRMHPELEGLIGFFVNTLVLRTDLSGNPRFRDLLAQVRESALDAYAHQDVPFEKLVEDLKPERDVNRNPLFQAMFVLQNVPGGGLTLAGLEVTPQAIESGAAKFDLTLTLTETAGRLSGYLEYATDLFDAATIERMVGHWRVLLEGIVADPETLVGELPLLPPAERHQLLVEWNDTAVDYPRDRCIHQLFEEQAARTPDSVAVVCEDRQLTYAELDARANQLAHYLRSRGVGPDVLVGICMERSLDMVVGLLGILKAGGAYVPLDPRYPQERLRFILEDTGLTVLLTHRSLAERLPASRCTVVSIDSPLSDADPGRGLPETTPNHLAYVIYTSGSTGAPKGVAIEHHSTVSFLHWVRATFTREERSGVLCATSICFDLSVFELFGALCWGGKAILVESAIDLATCRHRHEVTLVNTVPSIMQTLLESQGLPDSVVTVNLAGEPLREALADAVLAHRNVHRVNDLYGPTETTTYSTSAVRAPFQPATIGKPIANTQVYLLDPCLNPVPIGVIGELCIGGEGVARGYLNRKELTAERFIPDPFHCVPGARLYRTGDLARYRPDGSIELLGRADSQIKLRGFRIELGEIEAVLTRHPEVREAAVVVREDVPGDKRLVAYVVARDDSPAIGNLRALVEQQLPHYMVPAAFVVLASLPLTPNGKVDRKLLPAPEFEDGERAFESPCTPFETAIAEICGEVLNVPRVGRNDNFFDLGGHSLLAMQLISKINRALGIELTLRQLFETPDVRGLALAAQECTVLPPKPFTKPMRAS